MGLCEIRPERDGATEPTRGDVVAFHLKSDHPQSMNGCGIFGILGQNVPVYLFGFRQPSGLMVPQRQIEGLLNGELRHEAVSM
jgi:hypothetical protein